MQHNGPEEEREFSDPLRRACLILLWRTPLLLPLAVVGGVVCGGSIGWGIAVAALALAHLLRMRRILLCSLLCGLVVFAAQERRHRHAEEVQLYLAEHDAVTLQGVVVRELGRGCILETDWPGVRVALRGNMPWRVGDVVRATAQPLPTEPPPVQGMFSAERWMRSYGLAANLAYVSGEKVGQTYGWCRLVRAAEALRASLAERLMPPGAEDDMRCQVLCAMVLGEKERADYETMEVFRRSGCLHAFAVSGLHVGLVSGILWLLLRVCRVRPTVGRWVLLGGAGLYVLATGMAVPALRAYFMLAALAGGLIMRRRTSLFNAWCCVALGIIVVQPWQLYQPGFQLSFVVYAAICLMARYGLRDRPWFGPDSYIPARIRTRTERAVVGLELFVRGNVVISLSAWLISLPFIISQFHAVNTFSYLTNIILAPLLPIVMFCGLAALALAGVPLLGAWSHYLAVQCASCLLGAASLTGQHPAAYLPACPPAEPNAYVVMHLNYGRSFCILGNPGMLLGNLQNAADARYRVEPLLFHGGFTPAMVASGSDCSAETLRLLRLSWPQLGVASPRPGETARRYTSRAGEFILYFPPEELPHTPAANTQPIVLWKQPDGGRILYMGDASMSTLEAMPPEERRADVLILGFNPKEPLLDAAILRSMGLNRLILLPSAARHCSFTPQELSPTLVEYIYE